MLKTIDITRDGPQAFQDLQQSDTHIHIIGVDSDLFFTAAENRDTHKQLAQASSHVTYGEIQSVHGHDAFLIEFEQMEGLLEPIFTPESLKKHFRVLKFGGNSLANGTGIERVLEIISEENNRKDRIAVVLSARDKATDQLLNLLTLAAAGKPYEEALEAFTQYQRYKQHSGVLEDLFEDLSRLLEGVRLLGDYSTRIQAQALAGCQPFDGENTAGIFRHVFKASGGEGRHRHVVFLIG